VKPVRWVYSYSGKDLWKRWVLRREWKSEWVVENDSGENEMMNWDARNHVNVNDRSIETRIFCLLTHTHYTGRQTRWKQYQLSLSRLVTMLTFQNSFTNWFTGKFSMYTVYTTKISTTPAVCCYTNLWKLKIHVWTYRVGQIKRGQCCFFRRSKAHFTELWQFWAGEITFHLRTLRSKK